MKWSYIYVVFSVTNYSEHLSPQTAFRPPFSHIQYTNAALYSIHLSALITLHEYQRPVLNHQ